MTRTRQARRATPALEPDVNALVAGPLHDMAFVQASTRSRWGYKRAAASVQQLDVPLTSLVRADGTLTKIPNIGPASTRIILEALATGRSPAVDEAIEASGKAADVQRRRGACSRSTATRTAPANGSTLRRRSRTPGWPARRRTA